MVNVRKGMAKKLEFNIDDTIGTISKCKILFAQDDKLVLTKDNETGGVQIVGNKVLVTLNADDTLLFSAPDYAVVQVLVQYINGGKDATNKDRILILDVLGDEVV